MTNNIPILTTSDLRNIAYINKLNVELVISHLDLFAFKCENGKNYIINLHQKDSMMGHWVALFVSQQGVAIYFDPYGVISSPQIIKFIGKRRFIYNQNDLQDYTDISCGFYCLAFLHFMTHSRAYPEKRLMLFGNLFFDDTDKNRRVLQQYIKNNFIV